VKEPPFVSLLCFLVVLISRQTEEMVVVLMGSSVCFVVSLEGNVLSSHCSWCRLVTTSSQWRIWSLL
jgi:hypothetical protein